MTTRAGPGPAAETGQGTAQRRREAGQRAWKSGDSAERTAEAAYLGRGCTVLERRWRGQGGEIDLILRDGRDYVFCEVKKARGFAEAMARLRPAQIRRIHAAAGEYLGHVPEGQLAQTRFDLALVDGRGAVRLIENAFGHF